MLLNKVVKKISIFLILFFSLQIVLVNSTEKSFSGFSTVKNKVLVLLDASNTAIPTSNNSLSLANASHFDQDDEGNLYILNVDEVTGTTNIQKLIWQKSLPFFPESGNTWINGDTIPSYLNRDSDIAWGKFKWSGPGKRASLVVAEGNKDFGINNSEGPYNNCRDKTADEDNQNVKKNTTCLVFSRSDDLSFVKPIDQPGDPMSDSSTITTSIKQQYLNSDRYTDWYERRNRSGYSLEDRKSTLGMGTYMESPTACSQDQISSKNGFVVKFYCVPKPGVDYNSSNPEYDYRFIVYEPDLNGNIKTEFGLNIPFIDSKHIYPNPSGEWDGLYNSPLTLLKNRSHTNPKSIKCSLDNKIGIEDPLGLKNSAMFCTFLGVDSNNAERLFVRVLLMPTDRPGVLVSDYDDDTSYKIYKPTSLTDLGEDDKITPLSFLKIKNAGGWKWVQNGSGYQKKIGKGCMREGVDITTDLSDEYTFYVSCDDWGPDHNGKSNWDSFWATSQIPPNINSIKKITTEQYSLTNCGVGGWKDNTSAFFKSRYPQYSCGSSKAVSQNSTAPYLPADGLDLLNKNFGVNGTLRTATDGTDSVTFSNIKEIKSRRHPFYGEVIYVLDKGLNQIIVIGTDGSLKSQIGVAPIFSNLKNNTDTTIKSLFTSIGSSADLGFGFYQAYDKTEPFTNITDTPAGALGECDSSGCLAFSIRENGHLVMENISISAPTLKISSSDPVYDIDIANQDTDWPSAIRFVKNYFIADINSLTCSLRYVVIFSETLNDWDKTNDATDYLTNQLGIQFIIVTDKTQDFDGWNATRSAVQISSSSIDTPTDTPEGIVLNSTRIIDAIKAIVIPAGSQTSAEQSYTAPVIDENNIYLSSFEAYQNTEWDGFVRKYTLDLTTKRAGTLTWDASFPISRNIWTVFPDTPTNKNNFVSTNLTKINSLFTRFGKTISSFSHCTSTTNAEGLINFIRGQDHFDYDKNGNCSEVRGNMLSDIYHSQLVVVGPPDANIDSIRDNEESFWRNANSYGTFKTDQASREKMVYVASNSGLLHAFNDISGEEEWAFLPPFVAGIMPSIFTDTSNESNPIFSLDGSPVVHDTFFNNVWRTVLIIPYGRGGAGFSALNITDPDSPSHLYSVYHDADNERIHYMTGTTYNSYNYTDVPANLDFQKLGETWSNPKVVFYNDGTIDRLGLVMGAGYIDPNNMSDRTEIGNAVFVLDINDGTMIKNIPIEDFLYKTGGGCGGWGVRRDALGNYLGSYCSSPIPEVIENNIRNSTPNTPLIIKQNPDPINGTNYKGAVVYINDIEGSVHKINLTNISIPQIEALYDVNTIYGIKNNHKHTGNTTNGRSANRRNLMFHPLDAAYITDSNNDKKIWFFTGTGDGNDMNNTTSDFNNILIGMKDTNITFNKWNTIVMKECSTVVNFDGTGNSIKERTEGCQPYLHAIKNFNEGKNWQINIGSQKLSGAPIANNGTVYFPIYKPDATAICDTGRGYICATRIDNGLADIKGEDAEEYFIGSGRLAGYGKISKILAKEGYLIYSNSINLPGSTNTMKIKSLLGNGKKIVVNSYQK